MADIRCPMCGKPNPAGSDTCQYCQARLTPLKSGPPSEPLKPPSQPPGKPELGASAASGTGDWLSDLRSDETAEASFEESEAASGSSDFGDWFSRLEEPAASESRTPAQKPSQPEEEAIPDWMSEPKETPASAPGKEGESDWLQEFHAQASEEAVPGPGKSDEDSSALGATDWLSGLGDFSAPAKGETGQVTPDGSAEPAGFAEPESELPDWMKPASEPDAFRQPAALQESVPDWMREIGGEAAADELYGIEGAETTAPEGAAEPAGLAEPTEFTEPAAEMGDMPDWLKSQMPASVREESSSLFADTDGKPDIGWSQADTPSTPQAGVPDWLSEASAPAAGNFSSAAETPSEAPAEEIPADWFSKFGITSEEKPAEGTPAFVLSDDEMAPFVSGDEMAATEPVPGGLESLPDWLSQVPTEEPAPETPPARTAQPAESEAQADANLAPAQLPTWLEAMRPVESAAPSAPYIDESSSSLETAGPLAGLRGVLPAEAEIARIRKPPVYSNKLQISEAHQARVSLLEELVAAEGQPKPVTPHIAIVPQTALRLAIALVLILTVFGALWLSSERTPEWTPLPEPANVPQEIEDLRGQIEALSNNALVLVAFDYDPGFSGEMEASAAGIVAHLVEKRVPLLLVSTNPLGPALAERLVKQQVDELNSQLLQTPPYTTSLITNLGYIPGGIAGLRAFAETPAKIFPHSLDGEDIWTTAPLTTGATLAGFTLALVITDNPDTARAWIEQAEPVLEPSPLLMVVSAQAEPMIRPYYDSGQVQGMVTGLAGGAAYENKRGRNGLASEYWDAFSLSLLVATILILIGGLVNASLSSLARSKRKGEEQPYA
jgi:hypothetical protein